VADTTTAAANAIVPIEAAHAQGFHDCLDAVAREQRYLAQLQAPPFEKLRGFIADSVAADAAQFVALDAGQVVGWADIFPAWAQAVAHCGTLGMGVLASHRGQGVGRRLLLACIDKARDKGISRVTLEARADNQRAIRLYLSVGFQHETIKRRALRFEGEYFDAVQMSLML
jgi:putative acetyltransferase